MWAAEDTWLESGLISITVAPAARAIKGSSAAGCTRPEVPTTSIAWHRAARCQASAATASGSASPNQTTSGRTGAPQCRHGGGSQGASAAGSGTSSAGDGRRSGHQGQPYRATYRTRTPCLPAPQCHPVPVYVTLSHYGKSYACATS